MESKHLPNNIFERFAEIVGKTNIVTEINNISRYVTEPRALFHGKTPFVIKPSSVDEVSKILHLANTPQNSYCTTRRKYWFSRWTNSRSVIN